MLTRSILLSLAVLGLGLATAGESAASCTAQTCGSYVPDGESPSCSCYFSGPGCCRTAVGCSCDSDCELYGDCCSNYDPVCTAPVIGAIDPDHGNTAGSELLTLTGSQLGTSGATVTVGGAACTSVNHVSSSQVTCLTPPGQGTSKQVVLTLEGAQSNAVLFDYDPPEVMGIAPSSAPTEGGSVLTLTGQNFGLSGSVTVDGAACDPVFWTHEQVQCLVPAGQGLFLGVQLTAGLQSGFSPTPFSYQAPSINGLSPSQGPAIGGTEITLVGQNFGLSATATVDGLSCDVQSQTHQQLVCIVPPGSGADRPVQIDVASQTAQSPTGFSYIAAALPTLADSARLLLGAALAVSVVVLMRGRARARG